MNSKLNTYVFFGLLLVLFSTCGDDDDGAVILPVSGEKAITEFVVESVTGTIDEAAKTITLVVPNGTDLTSLSPAITISAFATVNPASGADQDFTNPVVYTVTAEDGTSVGYTVTITMEPCVSDDSIYEFTYDGKMYEVVRQHRTWEEAAACAVERGGYLAEINSEEENTAIFNEVLNNASIDLSMTKPLDGGDNFFIPCYNYFCICYR